MKKPIALTLLLALILSLVPVVAADDAPTVVYSTNILAEVDGHPIPSYNIGGYTCIVMEDLQYYGFNVTWDPDTATISAESAPVDTDYTVYADIERGVGGSITGSVYETNIRAFVNGLPIESYNIGGYTCVCIETLGDLSESVNAAYGYSNYLMSASWDAENAIISLATFRCQPDSENPVLRAGKTCVVRYADHAESGTIAVSDTWASSVRGEIDRIIPLYLSGTDTIAAYASPYGISYRANVLEDALNVKSTPAASTNPEDMADDAALDSGFTTHEYILVDDGVILYGEYAVSPTESTYSLRYFVDGEVIDILSMVDEITVTEYIYPCTDIALSEGETSLYFTIEFPNRACRYEFDLLDLELGMR